MSLQKLVAGSLMQHLFVGADTRLGEESRQCDRKYQRRHTYT